MDNITCIPQNGFNRIVIDTSKRWDKNSSMGTKIYLNGEELKGVRNIEYKVGVDYIPTVTIEMYADVKCVSEETEKGQMKEQKNE